MSGAEILIFGKLLLTFGGILAFGAHELWQLGRDEPPVGREPPA